MDRIAFLTCEKFPQLIPEEQALLDEFKKNHFYTQAVVWSEEIDWNEFNFVIVRNPWDYFSRYEQFLRVLKDIKDSKATLINSYETILWNLDKTYLETLTFEGIPTVPTFKIEKFNQEKFEDILMLIKAQEFVIKPVVGASGVDTFRKKVSLDMSEVEHLLSVFQNRDVLVQPFMPNIISQGEISFIFFNDKFSHAIKKTAKAGEFRIQEEHGGSVEVYKPSDKEVELALQILMACSRDYFYARVDVVEDEKGQLRLMELELVEPQLFFKYSEEASSLFVQEFKQKYQNKKA